MEGCGAGPLAAGHGPSAASASVPADWARQGGLSARKCVCSKTCAQMDVKSGDVLVTKRKRPSCRLDHGAAPALVRGPLRVHNRLLGQQRRLPPVVACQLIRDPVGVGGIWGERRPPATG